MAQVTQTQQVNASNGLRQTQKITASGSFVNWLLSNNETAPIVGEGGTEMMYSDRRAFEVLEVLKGGKEVRIQYYKAKRTDKNGMSEAQDYEYKDLSGDDVTLVARKLPKGGVRWYKKVTKISFDPALTEKADAAGMWEGDYLVSIGWDQDEVRRSCSPYSGKVIPGITIGKTKTQAVNVVFGVRRSYYDFSM